MGPLIFDVRHPVKHAFFDLDETLHDKRATLTCVSQVMHEHFDLHSRCSENDFRHAFVVENEIIQPRSTVFTNLRNRLGLTDSANSLQQYFDEHFHLHCKPFKGAIECLKWLKEIGMTVCCITNGRDFFQRNKIQGLGITDLLDVIVTSGETGIKKPDHGIFSIALEKIKANPEDSFYCGDNEISDIVPANEMGLTTIRKMGKESCITEANYSFNHFHEFVEIIRCLTSDHIGAPDGARWI